MFPAILTSLSLCALCVAMPPALAGGVQKVGEPLRLTLGRSWLLLVEGATRVQIDDPSASVADVHPLSTREVLVLPRGEGMTILRVWDRRGITEHEVRVASPLPALDAQVDAAIGDERITTRLIRGSVLLEGTVDDAGAAARAERIAGAFGEKVVNLVQVTDTAGDTSGTATAPASTVEQVRAALDVPGVQVDAVTGDPRVVVIRGKVPTREESERAAHTAAVFAAKVVNLLEVDRPAQVRVQVRMVDVDRRALQELGIRWSDQATWGQAEPGGEFRMLSAIAASIRALGDDNRANVLAAPSVLVSSGEKGEIVIGGQLPIPLLFTGISSGGAAPTPAVGGASNLLGQSVEFRDFGVKLGIEPTVGRADEIGLRLVAEVSAIDRNTAVVVAGSTIPGFTTKRTETSFRMRGGQTLVIGGLISREEARAVHKFPILSEIPVLGRFFQSVRKENAERELIIFVTPEVVAEEAAAG
ncbi:MAG: pilus assembly protein N-terminal domain-containing protein [Armatimonadetes bacterium]|nr:pilus assembly protein N-terminal domain-containing protein [Armatimonadota bacterium]